MPENRRNILAELKTVLEEITEVKTVVRSHMDIDIAQYASANLPLINILEPSESAEAELTDRRATQLLEGPQLRVHFVEWAEVPSTAYETLVKAIRDKIGGNFKLNNKVIACWVKSISRTDGLMPLYFFNIELRLMYCLNQIDT